MVFRDGVSVKDMVRVRVVFRDGVSVKDMVRVRVVFRTGLVLRIWLELEWYLGTG